MNNVILLFALVNLVILIYIYTGYPFLLLLLAKLRPAAAIRKDKIRPSVSLLISCYNEEAVIRKKLENSIKLDYPKDKIDIIVISDGSTDKTDKIVKEFTDFGVRLIRQEGRLGKTSGLNLAIPETKGDIIVFSDANAIYRKDAIIRLVENFNDETVGYVVGEAQYVNTQKSAASGSENTYWAYEILIKKLESKIHSMVGGDGAIYAIRKCLYEPLKETDINDFVNPLQIIVKGYRGVYEPSAICLEETAGAFEKEFKRKTRIVNRSFSGILRVKNVINPFKTGLFSIQILSHKILRWFAGFFVINFLVASIYLALSGLKIFQFIVLIELLFFECAYIGYLFKNIKKTFPIFHYAYYFVVVNIAALLGILKSFKGSVQVTWDTHRSSEGKEKRDRKLHFLVHGLAVALFIGIVFVIQVLLQSDLLIWKIILWSCIILVLYTLLGYPVVIYIWSKIFPKNVKQKKITPYVTMLICAYNEEDVIEQKIINSLDLEYPNDKLKIVIASDGSTDNTIKIAEQYKNERIEIIDYNIRKGKIGVINNTVPKLSGEIILFSDANTMFEKNSVLMLVRNFADTSVGAVSADVILENKRTTFGKGELLYYKYERFIQKKESLIDSIIGADGGMYAIRRELFVPVLEDTIIDDFVISMNVAINGYRLVYDSDAIGYEGNVITHKEEFLRKSRVIAGAIQSFKRGQGIPNNTQKKMLFCYISHKLLRWLSPILVVAILLSSYRLGIGSQTYGYRLLAVFVTLFLLIALVGFLLKNKISNPLFIIPFYFCLENVSALYGIYKGILNKQSVKWHKYQRKKAKIANGR